MTRKLSAGQRAEYRSEPGVTWAPATAQDGSLAPAQGVCVCVRVHARACACVCAHMHLCMKAREVKSVSSSITPHLSYQIRVSH